MAAEDWIPDSAFEDHPEDEERCGGENYLFRQGYRSVTCKHCGKTGLRWEDEDGRWILVGKNYEVHNCRQPSATLDDFDDLA